MRNISRLKKPLGPRSPAKKLRSPTYKLHLCRRRNAEGCLNGAVPSSSAQRAARGSAARGSACSAPRDAHPRVAACPTGLCSGRLPAGARPQTPSGSSLRAVGCPQPPPCRGEVRTRAWAAWSKRCSDPFSPASGNGTTT